MSKQDKPSLSAETIAWVEAQGGGKLEQLERHVARREAWLTAVRSGEGNLTEGFLRLERKPSYSDSISLKREVRICQALANSAVPVPAVYGWDPERRLALFERVAGSAAIDKLEDARQQRAVMEDFIDAVANLHQLSPADLGLEDALGTHDLSPRQCALNDLDSQLAGFADFVANYHDPLLTYGVQWLRRFAPERVQRVCLVQGDTGPVNFMFEGDRVTALVDWEWGHWGDPMEDLGNICVREFWNPSGGLPGLFQRYAEKSGLSYQRDAVMYYRIQQNMRGMIPIHAACQSRGMRESMAWYLAYRYTGDRSTCEALAEAMDVAVEMPPLPDDEVNNDPLVDAIVTGLERDLLPELQSGFSRSRACDLGMLVQCLERRQRYGEALQDEEAAEIGELLGSKQRSLADLCAAIHRGQLDDAVVIRFLARRAYRDEWLHQPLQALYPGRRWSAID